MSMLLHAKHVSVFTLGALEVGRIGSKAKLDDMCAHVIASSCVDNPQSNTTKS